MRKLVVFDNEHNQTEFLHPLTDLFTFVKQGEYGELLRRLGYLPYHARPCTLRADLKIGPYKTNPRPEFRATNCVIPALTICRGSTAICDKMYND